MRRPRFSLAAVTASVALAVALGGTAVAADHYIITSTSQIKPSVIRELRESIATAAKAPKNKAVVARVRIAAPVSSTGEAALPVPLTGYTWTQQANEVQQLTGVVTITEPLVSQCHRESEPYEAFISLFLKVDGGIVYEASLFGSNTGGSPVTRTYKLIWAPHTRVLRDDETANADEGATHLLFEPGSTSTHNLTAEAADDCVVGGGHFTIDALSIDALGFR